MVDFNFRRDASSRFGKNNRWANFPAISFGWIFTDEPFMAATNSWFNYGKLKFSYGKNGKQFSDNYLRYNMYTLGYNGLGGYAGQISNSTYNGVTAVVPDFSQLADNNLSWEESKQWNFGAELEFFNRRLFANLDIYNRKTDALLFGVAFPGYTGFSQVQSNVAGIMNYGFELSFDAYLFPRENDFQIQLQPSTPTTITWSQNCRMTTGIISIAITPMDIQSVNRDLSIMALITSDLLISYLICR